MSQEDDGAAQPTTDDGRSGETLADLLARKGALPDVPAWQSALDNALGQPSQSAKMAALMALDQGDREKQRKMFEAGLAATKGRPLADSMLKHYGELQQHLSDLMRVDEASRVTRAMTAMPNPVVERHKASMRAQEESNRKLDELVGAMQASNALLTDMIVGQSIANARTEDLTVRNGRLTMSTVLLGAAALLVTVLFSATAWSWWQTVLTCAGIVMLAVSPFCGGPLRSSIRRWRARGAAERG